VRNVIVYKRMNFTPLGANFPSGTKNNSNIFTPKEVLMYSIINNWNTNYRPIVL